MAEALIQHEDILYRRLYYKMPKPPSRIDGTLKTALTILPWFKERKSLYALAPCLVFTAFAIIASVATGNSLITVLLAIMAFASFILFLWRELKQEELKTNQRKSDEMKPGIVPDNAAETRR